MANYRSWFTVGVVGTGVAHDLASVLMSLMGNVALLRDQVSGHSVQVLDDLDAAVTRATALLNNLQESYQKRAVDLREISLGSCVAGVTAYFQQKAPIPLDLKVECAENILVLADGTLITLMLSELLAEPARVLGQSLASSTTRPSLGLEIRVTPEGDGRRVGMESRQVELKMEARHFLPWNFPRGVTGASDFRLRTHYYFSLARAMMRLFRGEAKIREESEDREILVLVFPMKKP